MDLTHSLRNLSVFAGKSLQTFGIFVESFCRKISFHFIVRLRCAWIYSIYFIDLFLYIIQKVYKLPKQYLKELHSCFYAHRLDAIREEEEIRREGIGKMKFVRIK
jgi:hypothetical protein